MYKKTTMFFTVFLILTTLLNGCLNDTSPVTLYVDKHYDSDISGWQVDHFNNIQDSIDAGDMNCTIFVNNGTYHENIIINKTISLVGEDANKTVIWGNIDDVLIIENGGQVAISGFTITNGGSKESISLNKAGIRIYSGNNTISGNIFINNTCGIYTEYSDNNIISENMFTNNYYGILFYTNSDNNNVTNNIFLANEVGCRIKGSKFNNVTKNLFSNNEGGVYLCCVATHNIIYSNTFYNNTNWNAEDWCLNQWNNSKIGNYWSDFHKESQGAYDDNNDGIVDQPYNISRGYKPEDFPNKDYYPLVNMPLIKNNFLSGKY